MPPQQLLPLCEPRRRPEQVGPAPHRAPPDPAPGPPGPQLSGRVHGSRPGRADSVDLGAKERRVSQLEALTSEPGFWDDQRSAQKVLREANGLRAEVDLWRGFE